MLVGIDNNVLLIIESGFIEPVVKIKIGIIKIKAESDTTSELIKSSVNLFSLNFLKGLYILSKRKNIPAVAKIDNKKPKSTAEYGLIMQIIRADSPRKL